jgi:hypothetical protein
LIPIAVSTTIAALMFLEQRDSVEQRQKHTQIEIEWREEYCYHPLARHA